MPYPCPVCGSAEKTFAHPKQHKQYGERGRLDVDDWYCHLCKARWESWDYIREGTTELKNIRLKDGRVWEPETGAQADAPCCPYCSAPEISLEAREGHNHRGDVERYRCETCGTIWQWITESSGKRWKRLWRRGTIE